MAIPKTASEFHQVRSSGIGASKVPCYSILTFSNAGILRYIFTFSVTSVLNPFLATAEKSKINMNFSLKQTSWDVKKYCSLQNGKSLYSESLMVGALWLVILWLVILLMFWSNYVLI